MPESKPTAKHTPGPWDNRSRVTVIRHTETGEWLAEVGGRSTQEARENATLIARAPDLLAENERLRAQLATLREAAQALVDATPNVIPGDMIFRPVSALRAALADSKGGE